jgi:hypothetical protein
MTRIVVDSVIGDEYSANRAQKKPGKPGRAQGRVQCVPGFLRLDGWAGYFQATGSAGYSSASA